MPATCITSRRAIISISPTTPAPWITPALTPGVAGTASNSQCTLNAGSSSVTTAGNDLTLNVALSFSNTFVGSRNVYLYAAGLSGQNSGWVKAGTWTPNPIAGPPAIVSLSPNAGAGTSVNVQGSLFGSQRRGRSERMLLQINTTQSSANACYVYYQPQGNHLYLANNAGAVDHAGADTRRGRHGFQQPMHAECRVQFGQRRRATI